MLTIELTILSNQISRTVSTIDTAFKTCTNVQLEAEIQITSKYDLPLHFKDKKLDCTNLMASCPTLQLWDKQSAFKFGFIPMGELDVPPTSRPSNVKTDPWTLHTMIKNSGEYSFKNCQINVKSQLNPDVWDELLRGYWDSQLLFLVRFGFPLDFDRNSMLESHPENHTSANNYQKITGCSGLLEGRNRLQGYPRPI